MKVYLSTLFEQILLLWPFRRSSITEMAFFSKADLDGNVWISLSSEK